MHVTVIHRISDPEKWKAVTEAAIAQGFPPGFSLPIQATAADGRTEVCIWDAPSVEALKEVIEPPSQGLAVNEYLVTEVEGLVPASA